MDEKPRTDRRTWQDKAIWFALGFLSIIGAAALIDAPWDKYFVAAPVAIFVGYVTARGMDDSDDEEQ